MKIYNRYAFLCLSLAAATTHAMFNRHFGSPENANPAVYRAVAANPENNKIIILQRKALIAMLDGDNKKALEYLNCAQAALRAKNALARQLPAVVAPAAPAPAASPRPAVQPFVSSPKSAFSAKLPSQPQGVANERKRKRGNC